MICWVSRSASRSSTGWPSSSILRPHRRARRGLERGARLDDLGDVAADEAIGRVALDQPLVGVPDADAAVEARQRVVEQGLRRLGAGARRLDRLLLLLELGDVAVDRQHAAVRDRPEVELDDRPEMVRRS